MSRRYIYYTNGLLEQAWPNQFGTRVNNGCVASTARQCRNTSALATAGCLVTLLAPALAILKRCQRRAPVPPGTTIATATPFALTAASALTLAEHIGQRRDGELGVHSRVQSRHKEARVSGLVRADFVVAVLEECGLFLYVDPGCAILDVQSVASRRYQDNLGVAELVEVCNSHPKHSTFVILRVSGVARHNVVGSHGHKFDSPKHVYRKDWRQDEGHLFFSLTLFLDSSTKIENTNRLAFRPLLICC